MMTAPLKQLLKEVSMFASLEEEALEVLAKISQMQHYKEGEVLFVAGDTSNVLMLLMEGVASVFKHDDKGNEIVISYFKRHEFLAEAATLRHSPLPSSARFQTDGMLIKIDLDAFEKRFLKPSGIAYAIIESLLCKIDLLQQNIHYNMATKSIDKVLQFYTKNPRLSVDLKQYEIASVLGMTPETFSRNIAKLVKENKLAKTRTGYKIVL